MMSDHHEGQQTPEVHRGGAARRVAHAKKWRRRARGSSGVLCGGDAGYLAVGD